MRYYQALIILLYNQMIKYYSTQKGAANMDYENCSDLLVQFSIMSSMSNKFRPIADDEVLSVSPNKYVK